MTRVAVTSRSFSKHPVLREALCAQYAQVTFNDQGLTLQGDALIEFLKAHDAAIVGLEKLNAATLAQLPELKVVSRFGVGLDTLDLTALAARQIRLAYTAGANKRAVAELVIAFALNLLRELPVVHQQLLAGQWQQRKGRQLSECTVGIIGLGSIGKDLAALLRAFDCRILGFDVSPQQDFCQQQHIHQVALDTLLQQADIVSLHLPLTPETKCLLNEERLALMKTTAILINTARGGLVDEEALFKRLSQGQLAAAAFDVFANEPAINHPLLQLPNFFATPHIGGSTEEAILAMGQAAILGLTTAQVPEMTRAVA